MVNPLQPFPVREQARWERATRMRIDGTCAKDIAREIGVNYNSLRRMFSEYDIRKPHTTTKRAQVYQFAAPALPQIVPISAPVSADRVRWELQRYLGTTHQPVERPPVTASTFRRVAVFGDVHGDPDPALLAAVVNKKPDTIIIGGDLFDAAQVNPHQISDAAITIRAEMANVRGMLEFLTSALPEARVFVMRGNHDEWIRKHFLKDGILPELLQMFFRDPLQMVIDGLPGIELVQTRWEWHHPNGARDEFGKTEFMFLYGDVIISHFNFTGRKPGDAADKLHAWLRDWEDALGLPKYRVLIQHHGHKLAHIELGGGHHIRIEPGMAGRPRTMGYQVDYNAKWRPGAIGACYLEQSSVNGEWRTNLESVSLIRPRRA